MRCPGKNENVLISSYQRIKEMVTCLVVYSDLIRLGSRKNEMLALIKFNNMTVINCFLNFVSYLISCS